jgi:hypothetical protein
MELFEIREPLSRGLQSGFLAIDSFSKKLFS